jgi:acetyl esterase/lipase
VKKHADEMNVNADEIFVVGFSAGGHLTANLAVDYANVPALAQRPLDCKPTAVGLSYPVISKIDGHQGSYENLLKGYTDEAKEELLKVLNLDEVVSETTAPSFLWATANDGAVPASNALRFALACARKKVPYEIHVYPDGPHGLSLADNEISAGATAPRRCMRWIDDCAAFFRSYCVEKF